MEHIYEHAGILLRVLYEQDAEGVPTFQSARVLDSQYRPTGPDLLPLLHGLLIVIPTPDPGIHEAESVLSALTGEINARLQNA